MVKKVADVIGGELLGPQQLMQVALHKTLPCSMMINKLKTRPGILCVTQSRAFMLKLTEISLTHIDLAQML